MNWKDLDREYEKGIGHVDGICAWCDHIRQLEQKTKRRNGSS